MKKLILAAIAGIGVGILLAPRKGSETAQKLRERFKDFTDEASDEADDMLNNGKKAFAKGRNKVSEMM